jgi:hypothetical protein
MMGGDHSCAAVLCPLSCSRPTAVNLSDSAVKLKAVAAAAAGQPGATAESVTAAVVAAAEATMQEDIDANKVGVPSDSYGLLKGHPHVCWGGLKCNSNSNNHCDSSAAEFCRVCTLHLHACRACVDPLPYCWFRCAGVLLTAG